MKGVWRDEMKGSWREKGAGKKRLGWALVPFVLTTMPLVVVLFLLSNAWLDPRLGLVVDWVERAWCGCF